MPDTPAELARVTEVAAAGGHAFEPMTEFCTRCGCRYVQFAEQGQSCAGGGNVVGISHRIAERRFFGMLGTAIVAAVTREIG